MDRRTTIQIPNSLREDLKKLKKYKRETYEDIIRKLMSKKEARRKIKQAIRGKIS